MSKWWGFLAGMMGLKVGLAWTEAAAGPNTGAIVSASRRTVALRDLTPIMAVPGCSFVSLQLGEPARQLLDYHDRIYDVSYYLRKLEDTVGLIRGLDLVITADAAIAQTAASMGKPTWHIDTSDDRLSSRRFPTVRTYKLRGDLAGVLATVVRDLERKASPFAPAAGSIDDHLRRAVDALQNGRTAEAVTHFRARWAAETGTAGWRCVQLGKTLLAVGCIPEGFEEFARPFLGQPVVWDGRRLNGEVLVIDALPRGDDPGAGDAIQFCRYAVLAAERGARVIVAVPPLLVRLMRTLRNVHDVVTDLPPRLPPGFLGIPLFALPHACGTTLESIPAPVPYLKGDPAPWRAFLDSLPGRLKVGLVWSGRPGTTLTYRAMDETRSVQLADLAPILTVPDVSFVSLQLGHAASQVREFPSVADVSHGLRDWADTAGLMSALDLVISVDTATVHLAGALGRPVWLLNRYDTCWRWMLNRSDSPWYPTMRIYRQEAPGAWAPVIAEVARALAALAEAPTAGAPKAAEPMVAVPGR